MKFFTSNFKILILLIIAFCSVRLSAQVPCGFSLIHESRMATDSAYRNETQLMEAKIAVTMQQQSNAKKQSAVIDVPVVVHVIHLGEALGTGSNIPDAQILGAIQGLNDRYKATNGFGVDMQINFCLAVRDPNGNPTTGINRVNGSGVGNYATAGMYALQGVSPSTPTCTDNDTLIKNLSKWPPANYLNIWIVQNYCLATGLTLYGQASGQRGSRFDGLTMLYSQMTSTSITLAHEIGHMFILNHTYQGDGTGSTCPVNTYCGINGDLVCDTPPHKRNDFGTTNPCTVTGIWNNSRFNYMAYSWAVGSPATFNENTCLFTQGQKDRARAVIYSLDGYYVNSTGCMPSTSLDAGIASVVYPVKTSYTTKCTFPNSLSPIVRLKNYGSTTLTAATIKYQADNGPLSTYAWSGNLLKDSSVNVSLPGLLFAQGTHTFTAYTINPNSSTDGYGLNDTANFVTNYVLKQTSFMTLTINKTNPTCFGGTNGSATVTAISSPSKVIIKEDWEGVTDWTVANGSEPNYWMIGTATANGGSKSMYITTDNVTNTYNLAALSSVHLYKDFYFPVGATNIKIKFDWKCVGEQSAPFSGIDRLRVYLLETTQTPFPSYQYGYAANYYLTYAIGSYYSQATFKTDSIMGLDGNAGTTKRIDFNWRNNASGGAQSPAAIDNVIISYDLPGNASPYTYLWNSAPTQTTSVASALPAGTYSVQVTDANTCSSSASLTLTQPAAVIATITASGSTTLCQGNSVTLTSSAANSYSWSNGATTQSVSVSTSGNYSVTVTNTLGCSGTSSVKSVTVNPLPVVNAVTSNTLLCTGQAATLTASGASTYTWNTTGNSASIVVSPTIQTTYSVSGTNSNSCMNSAMITQSVSLCTGVNNLSSERGTFMIYPNPTKGMLIIESENNVNGKLQVLNALGQELIHETIQNRTIINVEQFSPGIYFVKIMEGSNQQIFKLIKE